MKFAARVSDVVSHIPPSLSGLGSTNVFIGGLSAWRGIPLSLSPTISNQKAISDGKIKFLKNKLRLARLSGNPIAVTEAELALELGKTEEQLKMSVNVMAVAGLADVHTCTTPFVLLIPHGPGVVIDGSSTVTINGLPACRAGDTILEAAGPPNRIALGCMSVIIGG